MHGMNNIKFKLYQVRDYLQLLMCGAQQCSSNTANFAVLSSCLNWEYKEGCGMCPRYHSSTV